MEAPNREDMPYFHGKLTRQETEQLLSSPSLPDGTWLMRVSTQTQGDYVLSMTMDRQVLHFQVKHQGECWYCIDDGPLFEGLDNIIQHYTTTSDGLPRTLTKQCLKQVRKRNESDGNSKLHDACIKANEKEVKGSSVKMAEINNRNKCGRTALHEAVRGKNEKCVQALLEKYKGLDINGSDDNCYTPLHFACMLGLDSICRMLIVAGAAPHVRTTDMETPRDIAARLAHTECAKLCGNCESGIKTEKELAMRDHPWYHGKINRKTAESIVGKYGNGDGLFLVRESKESAGDFVLTMSSFGKPFHFQIQRERENLFYIDDGPFHEGLKQTIEYYRTSADGLPTQLKQYCRRSTGARLGSQLLQATILAPDTEKLISHKRDPKKTGGGKKKEDDDTSDDDYDHPNDPDLLKGMPKKPKKPTDPVGYNTLVAPPDREAAEIKKEELELGAELGKGEFGAVISGFWKRPNGTKIPVAIKTIKADSTPGVTSGYEMQGKPAAAANTENHAEHEFLKEADVMSKLQDDFVVRLMGVCLSKPMMIVQELVPLGALFGYLPKNKKTLKNDDLTLFATEIAAGMAYLESQRFVHRDLATRNILVSTKEIVKISDFGLSRVISSDETYYKASAGGKWPVKWYAPESVYYGKFTHKSDGWSFGVTMWEIWSFSAVPYDDLTGREVLELLERGTRLTKPKGCTDEVYKVMLKMWEHSPEKRPTFKAVKDMLQTLLPAKWKTQLPRV